MVRQRNVLFGHVLHWRQSSDQEQVGQEEAKESEERSNAGDGGNGEWDNRCEGGINHDCRGAVLLRFLRIPQCHCSHCGPLEGVAIIESDGICLQGQLVSDDSGYWDKAGRW